MKKKITITIVCVTIIVIFIYLFCKEYDEKMAQERRTAQIADSIAKSEAFVADSIAKREAFVADSLAKMERINTIKNSIRITSYWLSSANSAGGRDVHFNFKNKSDKTIKYLTFEVYFYNAVDDLVYCEIRNYCSFRGKYTGPVKPQGHSDGGYWDCVIYNYQAKRIVLTSIDIEYTDGSSLHINKEELKYIEGYKGDE
ncbi:MAG: hypothetical protein MJZ62_04745 [Bacteroidales bacterium]|nr:hypothetical protein [Bacteroidales bacterium]